MYVSETTGEKKAGLSLFGRLSVQSFERQPNHTCCIVQRFLVSIGRGKTTVEDIVTTPNIEETSNVPIGTPGVTRGPAYKHVCVASLGEDAALLNDGSPILGPGPVRAVGDATRL
jgi:hypothetical protein